MKVLKPYAKVIAKMDARKQAWKTSRPMFSEENLNFDKVAEMDLSLNSMLVYTIEMRSSVIFRDLVFSLRPLEGWALSTRSMPITRDTIRMSSEFSDCHDQYACIINMFDMLDSGKSRDQSRDVLPLGVSSTYTFTIDFRVLMSFIKNLEIIDTDLFNLYGKMLLDATDTWYEYKRTTVRSSLEYYQIADCEREYGTREVGNMMIGYFEMKSALASQFLRQHYSKVKIDIWNMIEDYGYFNLFMTQRSTVGVCFYIDSNSYARLMSMRSHWVLDWSPDMWGGLVGDYIRNMSAEDFWEFTPAGGGKPDPYWADCYNRVTLEDPGVPCPIMTEWRGALEHRRREIGDNPILDMYERLFNEGFIKDNPDNEHRVLFFDNVEKHGGMNTGVKL